MQNAIYRSKAKWILLPLLAVLAVLIFRYSPFGSDTETCSYSGAAVTTPPELFNSEWLLKSDLPISDDEEACVPLLKGYQVIGTPDEPFKEARVLYGTSLRLEAIVEVDNRGLATLEGRSKIHYLLLTDPHSKKYALPTVNFRKETPWIVMKTSQGPLVLDFANFFDISSNRFRFQAPAHQ